MPNFDHTSHFTRCDYKTNSFTLIDGILMSKSLRQYVSNVRISDYGNNVSDHRPVELNLDILLEEINIETNNVFPTVNWSKLSDDWKQMYKQRMAEGLDAISILYDIG